MWLSSVILFLAYVTAGCVTVYVLEKYGMHIAKTVYTVVFLLFASYFPINVGRSVIYYIIVSKIPQLDSYLQEYLIDPTLRLSGIINASVIATIALSLFFSATVIVFALYTAKAIYRLVKRKNGGVYIKRKSKKTVRIDSDGEFVPYFAYRYIFCRYNC